jgi:hypothetical protein
VLTVLGAVFDKVYFPGVYLPKDGFDQAELDKEIERLEALPVTRGYDTELLIGILKFTEHASTLEGFCEFTALPDDPFGNKSPVPGKLVQAVYEAIYGPPLAADNRLVGSSSPPSPTTQSRANRDFPARSE